MMLTLYKVTLRGFIGHGTDYRTWYVVASDPTAAARFVQERVGSGGWSKEGLGFASDRQLQSIEVLAEEKQYTDAPAHLIVPSEPRQALSAIVGVV